MNDLETIRSKSKRVDIVVSLWIHEDADVAEVLENMNYEFTHAAIEHTEIVDVNTEV
jgi:hypothetical protein